MHALSASTSYLDERISPPHFSSSSTQRGVISVQSRQISPAQCSHRCTPHSSAPSLTKLTSSIPVGQLPTSRQSLLRPSHQNHTYHRNYTPKLGSLRVTNTGFPLVGCLKKNDSLTKQDQLPHQPRTHRSTIRQSAIPLSPQNLPTVQHGKHALTTSVTVDDSRRRPSFKIKIPSRAIPTELLADTPESRVSPHSEPHSTTTRHPSTPPLDPHFQSCSTPSNRKHTPCSIQDVP